MGRKFGISFSWKRAVGLSGLKGKISRKIGVPLTQSGRRQKVGRLAGCCLPLLAGVGLLIFVGTALAGIN